VLAVPDPEFRPLRQFGTAEFRWGIFSDLYQTWHLSGFFAGVVLAWACAAVAAMNWQAIRNTTTETFFQVVMDELRGNSAVVSCQLSVVSYRLSVVSGQLSVVSCQLSVVSCADGGDFRHRVR